MPLFFGRKRENRADSCEDPVLTALLGSRTVTREMALQVPTVAGGIDLIANLVAGTPIRLYKDTPGAKATEVTDDYRLRLLNDETGDTLNANEFWKAMVRDYYLGKGGYAYINRQGGKVVALHYVEERRVTVLKGTDPIFKDFDLAVDGYRYKPYDFLKVLRNTTDGAAGVPLTCESANLIETAYAAQVFEKNMVRRGGNKKGFLKSEKRLDKDSLNELRRGFARLYSADGEGSDNFVLLNNGIDFKESSNTSVELQLNENKLTNAGEFAKLFHVSPDCISGKATEQDVASIARLAAIPLMTTIQCALNKDLLLEREKGQFYFAFDTKELLRGDMKTRFAAYKTALDANFMQIDEVRYAEDMEPLGLDWIRLGLQDVLYNPKTHELFTPNTGTSQQMGQNEKKTPEPLPAEGEDAILEERGRTYKRDEKGRFAGGGGGGRKSHGRKSPKGLKLGKAEYGKVIHAINTSYHEKYEGKSTGFLQMATGKGYFEYSFAIHGYDDYTIKKKRSI
ncbi:phage portal protein [uncultured Gemmiger sp.]|uniref:phage portal protein n=1 Tax=uncultured Gemmiger sp. TaxID=1623490 RepID=UPI0025D99188|nr:phage portal protein [uncultured Gemmiger sp.]